MCCVLHLRSSLQINDCRPPEPLLRPPAAPLAGSGDRQAPPKPRRSPSMEPQLVFPPRHPSSSSPTDGDAPESPVEAEDAAPQCRFQMESLSRFFVTSLFIFLPSFLPQQLPSWVSHFGFYPPSIRFATIPPHVQLPFFFYSFSFFILFFFCAHVLGSTRARLSSDASRLLSISSVTPGVR